MTTGSDFAMRLGRLLAATAQTHPYSEADLADLLEAQLDQKAPGFDIAIRDVLQNPKSSDDLVALKEYAKEIAKNSGVPDEIPLFLYVSAIRRARVVFSKRITSQDDETIARIVVQIKKDAWAPGLFI